MLCHCGKTALYRVKDRGFCRKHKDDAFTMRRQALDASESKPADFTDYHDIKPRKHRGERTM